MQLWKRLEVDPVFQRPSVETTTEETKHRTALQLRQYLNYQVTRPETAKLPYKQKTKYLMTVNEALAITFPDVSVKNAIGISLFKNTLTTLGTERHEHILDAAWRGKVCN